jgi:hypothetical protein
VGATAQIATLNNWEQIMLKKRQNVYVNMTGSSDLERQALTDPLVLDEDIRHALAISTPQQHVSAESFTSSQLDRNTARSVHLHTSETHVSGEMVAREIVTRTKATSAGGNVSGLGVVLTDVCC